MNFYDQLMLRKNLGLAPAQPAPPAPVSGGEVPTNMVAPREVPANMLPDMSSLGGDLRAGGFQLANALEMGKLGATYARGNLNSAQATGPMDMAARIDENLAELQNRWETSLDPAEQALLAQDMAGLQQERDGYLAIGQTQEFQDSATANRQVASDMQTRIAMEHIPAMIANAQAANRIPMNPAAEAAGRETGDGGWADTKNFASQLAEDPWGVSRNAVARSIPTMLPGVAAAVGGQFLGGPLAAGAASGVVSGATDAMAEASGDLANALIEAGVDANSPDSIKQFFAQNPDVLADAYADGARHGGIVGTINALTAGIGGKIVAGSLGKSLGTKVAAIGGATALNTAGDGTGEALAGLANDGKVSMPEVLNEMLGGLAMGGPQAAGQMGAEALRTLPKNPGKTFARELDQASRDAPATERAFRGGGGIMEPGSEVPADMLPPALAPAPVAQAAPVRPPAPVAPPVPVTAQDDEEIAPTSGQEVPAEMLPPTQAPASVPEPVASTSTSTPAPTPVPAEMLPEPLDADEADVEVATPTAQVATPTAQVATPADPARRSKIYTPENEEVEVDTLVMEADDLVSSDNPAYPQELQPRDRNRASSEIQIEGIANKPTPSRLDQSNETDRGSPIIGSDSNVVESGNGRVMGLRRAYQRGTANEYRTYVEGKYPEAVGMKNPVIVRRRVTAVNGQDFTSASNVSATMEMSPTENAKNDARQIDESVMGLYRGGDLASAPNRDMVRAIIGKLPKSAQNALLTKDGGFSIEGQRRVGAAMFTRAYGESNLLTRLTENPDDDIRSVTNALAEAAPAMAGLRLEIEGKRVSSDVDLSADLLAATRILADMRQRGQNLNDYRAQTDAFADPNSETTEAILDAFYNETGTRMVSKKAMTDFLNGYAERAKQQRTDQATLPGVAPVPLKSAKELINDTREANRKDDNDSQPALFESASDGRSNGGGRREKQRTVDGQSREETSRADQLKDEGTRAPKGGFTPTIREASFTSGASPFEQAWRDAGHDPDAANLKNPREQVNILTRLMEKTFGLKTTRNPLNPGKAIDAKNQMLDAYRNVRHMLATLGLPLQGLSLNGTLSMSLEGYKGRYLGMYDPNTTTIHMPGRSNSFAHEWGHALDHFLRNTLTPQAEAHLLSKVARREGIDPNENIQAAYVSLIQRMFFDDTALAVRMMALEVDAAKVDKNGSPTKGALNATEQLKKLAAGNTQLRIAPSAYRTDSANYSPAQAGYYASVHEMFARAFEAYVGHKMEQSGAGSNAFVTKGDEAYLSDADARLAMTFPKADERLAIFMAFDDVFHHLRVSGILGIDPATAPGPDTDVMAPAHWHKLGLQQALAADDGFMAGMKRELTAHKNNLSKLVLSPIATLKSSVAAFGAETGLANADPMAALSRVWDYTRGIVNSTRGTSKLIIARAPKDARGFLQYLLDGIATDPGTGRESASVVEEISERRTLSVGAEITAMLKATGLDLNPLTRGGLLKKSSENILKLLYDEASVPNATPGERKVASGLRRIMDTQYLSAVEAGLEIGYVENKGYLPRILDRTAVNLNPQTFRERAAKLYEIHFDNETDGMSAQDLINLAGAISARVAPGTNANNGAYSAQVKAYRAAIKAYNEVLADPNATRADKAQAKADMTDARKELSEVVRPDYGTTSAENWLRRTQTGGGVSFDSLAPDADFKAKRSLPPEAEEIMGDMYLDDPLDLVMGYVRDTTSRTAFQDHFGVEKKDTDSLDKILGREAIKDAIRANPRKYDPKTPAGRLAIMRDLADPAKDNIRAIALEEARLAGANPDDLLNMNNQIANIMGTSPFAKVSRATSAITGAVVVYGAGSLLPRAAWTSLAEPMTFYLKTGDFAATSKMLGAYMREAIRSAKSTKELSAIADMVGIVSSPLHDIIMMNRVTDGGDGRGVGAVLMQRFFRANLLTQLTNGQRRATFYGSFFMMQGLANTISANATTPKERARQEIARGDLRDAGVSNAQMDAFVTWLNAQDGFPDMATMLTKEGKLFAQTGARLVDQIIQNPRRADKSAAAMHPVGRLVFGLLSFIWAFTRNVITANINRGKRVYAANVDAGVGKTGAALEASGVLANRLAVGFAGVVTAQAIVGVFRAMILDNAQWQKHGPEEDDDRKKWLFWLAVSRSGIWGATDPVIQAMTGLRYERDLSNLGVGPAIGSALSHTANMYYGSPFGPRNSPNNDNAEHTAVKSAYRMFGAPLLAAGLAFVPAGTRVGAAVRAGALMAGTSNSAAATVADQFFTKTSKGVQ